MSSSAETNPAFRAVVAEAARRVAIRARKNEDELARDRVLVLVAAELEIPGERAPDLPEQYADLAWAEYLLALEAVGGGAS